MEQHALQTQIAQHLAQQCRELSDVAWNTQCQQMHAEAQGKAQLSDQLGAELRSQLRERNAAKATQAFFSRTGVQRWAQLYSEHQGKLPMLRGALASSLEQTWGKQLRQLANTPTH
ncbi:hypothetical protein [Ferrimonas marina]|uniref:Uncharacterized protein n=1 Tax=Ferrimonas marina TaxID=299255 RepID=A0A1M5TVQ1_9GAMM|nr:hypothetical protein [Ferrimonas marina]SHH54794.1 hypothetical protein SAMN02745129_2295 [Ferrimonas marina]